MRCVLREPSDKRLSTVAVLAGNAGGYDWISGNAAGVSSYLYEVDPHRAVYLCVHPYG